MMQPLLNLNFYCRKSASKIKDSGSSKKGKVPTLKIKFGGRSKRKGGGSSDDEEDDDVDSDAEFEEMLKIKEDTR